LKKLATIFTIIAVTTIGVIPVAAQEQLPPGVLPYDDPQRPQPPQGVQVEREKKGGLLYAAGRYVDDHCGNLAAGLGGAGFAACFPRHWEPTAFYGGKPGLSVGLNVHNDRFRTTGPQFGITSSISWAVYQRYTGYFGWNNPVSQPAVTLTGYYDDQTREQFWGLGPDSDEDDRSTYGWERYGVEAKVSVPRHHRISGHAGVRYEESDIHDGRSAGSDPRVEERFDPDEAPGLDVARQEYVVPNATVVIDLTRNPGGRPTLGAIIKGWWEMYSTQNDIPLEWTTIGGSASVHLGSEFHNLSFMAGVEEADPEGSEDEILFSHLPSLGGSTTLRGFPSRRFRDRAAGWGTVAYRFALWRGRTDNPHARAAAIETQIFYDIGGVGDDIGDVDFTDEYSYGIEFRGYGPMGHLFGVGLARGGEGISLNFTVSDVF
jgi:outer membrane protein assembly factor BamA